MKRAPAGNQDRAAGCAPQLGRIAMRLHSGTGRPSGRRQKTADNLRREPPTADPSENLIGTRFVVPLRRTSRSPLVFAQSDSSSRLPARTRHRVARWQNSSVNISRSAAVSTD